MRVPYFFKRKTMVRIVRIGNNRQTRETSNSDFHRGPLLLQDYNDGQPLPTTLHTLFELPAVKDYFHALCVVFHNLTLESGFYSLSTPNMQHPLDISHVLSSSTVSIEYSHQTAKKLVLYLNFSVLGPYILINCLVRPCVNTPEKVLHLQIKASDFVKIFRSDSKPINEKLVYKNMSKLSRIYKSNVSYKALTIMRAELKLPTLEGILTLHREIMVRILSHLDFDSLCLMSQTCHSLRRISKDDHLWCPLFIKEFGSPTKGKCSSWKKKYKKHYLKKKREEKAKKEAETACCTKNIYPSLPVSYPVQNPSFQFPFQPINMRGEAYSNKPQHMYGPIPAWPNGPITSQYPFQSFYPCTMPRNPVQVPRFDALYGTNGKQCPRQRGVITNNNTSLQPRLASQNLRQGQPGWIGSYNGYYYV